METPLRQARLRRQLTIKFVANSINIDPANLSRLERGEQSPSKETAAALAKFFGHEVSELQIIYPERYINTTI